MTGYEVAKKVNELLRGANLKEIPAQMIYNYIGKGYIKSQPVNGQNQVSVEDAAEWAEKYLTKRLAKAG